MKDEDDIQDEQWADALEEELEKERRGRKIKCTCDSDPDFCELHGDFSGF